MIELITTIFGFMLLSLFTFLVVMFYVIIIKEVIDSITRKEQCNGKGNIPNKLENTNIE